MAESTKRLSDQVRAKHDLPWKEIAGFRNILVHDYLGDIDNNIVWNTIQNELPVLLAAMKEELE